jgi:hypothetical protein
MSISGLWIFDEIPACLGRLAIIASGAARFATPHIQAIDAEYSPIIANDAESARAMQTIDSRIPNFGRLGWEIVAGADGWEEF